MPSFWGLISLFFTLSCFLFFSFVYVSILVALVDIGGHSVGWRDLCFLLLSFDVSFSRCVQYVFGGLSAERNYVHMYILSEFTLWIIVSWKDPSVDMNYNEWQRAETAVCSELSIKGYLSVLVSIMSMHWGWGVWGGVYRVVCPCWWFFPVLVLELDTGASNWSCIHAVACIYYYKNLSMGLVLQWQWLWNLTQPSHIGSIASWRLLLLCDLHSVFLFCSILFKTLKSLTVLPNVFPVLKALILSVSCK